MKNFKFWAIALVAIFGLNSCSEDCDHEFIEHDFSQELVGTWTYVNGAQAEAMVIKADGSFTTTGVMKGGYLYEEKGTIKVVNNKVTLAFDGDKETFEGRLEFVAGKSMSLVMFDDNDVRLDYDYCENDLADEVVGMWVCNDFPTEGESDMMIQTFYENGKCTLTGLLPLEGDSEQVLNEATNYSVIGDLLFIAIPAEKVGGENTIYVVDKLIYTPNGTAYGDILTLKTYPGTESEASMSFLRVKQNLDLANKAYDYSATYISNAKGEDKDVPFLNTSFNFAKMDGSIIDKFLKSTLFSVEFPDANTFKYSFLVGGQNTSMTAPIEVEGNKVTIKMSENNPALHDVEFYTFQDQDNTQMHLFMPTASFEKFFANTSVYVMLGNGQLDENDAEAIAGVYQTIADAVESINLSIIMK